MAGDVRALVLSLRQSWWYHVRANVVSKLKNSSFFGHSFSST
jgi:hypothetical protein